MAVLTIDSKDARLLERALDRKITLLGRLPNGRYQVTSSRAGEPPHELIVNPSGRIACNCTAGTYGARCVHAAWLRAFLAWQAQQEGAER
jgi:hypothetical protein